MLLGVGVPIRSPPAFYLTSGSLTLCPSSGLRMRPFGPWSFPRRHLAAPLLLAAVATCSDAHSDGLSSPSSISLSSDAPTVLVGQVANISVTGGGTTGLIWYVNGVVGGDAIVGRVDQGGHYTAPLIVPQANPVHISSHPHRRHRAGFRLSRRFAGARERTVVDLGAPRHCSRDDDADRLRHERATRYD